MPDGMRIEGRPDGPAFGGGEVDSRGDHRIAMSFSIASLRAAQPIAVRDVANVATSFPGFVGLARSVGLNLAESAAHDARCPCSPSTGRPGRARARSAAPPPRPWAGVCSIAVRCIDWSPWPRGGPGSALDDAAALAALAERFDIALRLGAGGGGNRLARRAGRDPRHPHRGRRATMPPRWPRCPPVRAALLERQRRFRRAARVWWPMAAIWAPWSSPGPR